NAGRDLAQQFDGAGESAHGIGRVLRLFEPHGGVGAQLDGGGGAANAGSVEIRAFEHHAGGAIADGAMRAADHSGQRDGAASIGNHQVGRIERVFFVVQRVEMLPGGGGADEDGAAAQQIGVEGVHGLGQLRHHVV